MIWKDSSKKYVKTVRSSMTAIPTGMRKTFKNAWRNRTMKKKEILEDYTTLQNTIAIYEYLSESDLADWYETSKKDNYEEMLKQLCTKYDLQYHGEDDNTDSTHEGIYETENIIIAELEKRLIK